MNSEDWNWLAGIWEGEGTAGLRWAKKRHEGSIRRAYLYMAISQRETSMLEEVKRIAGLGKIYNANRKDGGVLFCWYCACAQARSTMTALLPYVRSLHKRDQLVEALKMDAEMREKGRMARTESLRRGCISRWGSDWKVA